MLTPIYRYGLVPLVLLIAVLLLLTIAAPVHAQSCDGLIESYRLATSQQACRYINNNYACYGYRNADGWPVQPDIVGFRFDQPRDRQPVLRFDTVNTHRQEGAVLMLLKTFFENPIKLILFGDSVLEPVTADNFILRITDSQLLCESTPSGLVAHTPSGQQGLVTVNGVNIELGSTAYVTLEGSEQIVYYSNADGDWELYTMNSVGGNIRQLTYNQADDLHANWAPNGRQLVFQSNVDGDYEIYVMNEDGSGLRQLTSNRSSEDHPSWSPDGQRIAFDSDRDRDREIYTVDSFGGDLHKLTSNTQHDRWPVWSPDGSQIAFYSSLDGDYDIYVMNADGSERYKLTQNRADDRYPVWSPDGRRIAFASDLDGDWEIYVMNADGADLRQLTYNTQDTDWGPTWSIDGRRIGFASTRDGDNEIYVMNADGTDVRQITSNRSRDELPIWQPTAFSSDESMTVTNMEGQVVVAIPQLGIRQVVPVGNLVQIALSGGVPVDFAGPFASPFFASPVVQWLRDVGLPSVVNPNEGGVEGVPPCGGAIEYGTVVNAAIATPGQECLYTFFGSAGDLVNIRMTVSFGSIGARSDSLFTISQNTIQQVFDPWLDLRDPNDDLVAFSDNDSTNLDSFIREFALPVSGQYTIVARSAQNASTGQFQLTLSTGRIVR